MKKVIKIIVLISSLLSFLILFNEGEIKSIDNIRNVERKLSNVEKIAIPNGVTNQDQKVVYDKLTEVADKYKANLYYSRVKTEVHGEETLEKDIKYVYLNDSNYFQELKLNEGRGFNLEDKESELFLSTEKTNDKSQIGSIACLDKEYKLEVRTLKNFVDNGGFLDGGVYVEVDKTYNIEDFIKDLQVNSYFGGVKVIDKDNYDEYNISMKWIVVVGLYLIVMLLVLYDTLKKYKNISVKKMLGYSNFHIYFEEVIGFIKSQIIIQAIVVIVLGVIKLPRYNYYVGNFLKDILIMYFLQLIIMIIMVTIPYLFINKVKISNMIKNKQPTKEILIVNSFMKIIFLVTMFFILNLTLVDFSQFKNLYSKDFKSWEKAKEYAIIPTIMNASFEESDYMEKFFKDCKHLYSYFSDKGAILADFSWFIEGERHFYLRDGVEKYHTDRVTVNPNYLVAHPIYDINGKKVIINNDEKDIQILVPEEYKEYESDIVKTYSPTEKDKKISGWDDIEVKITWIKSNQKMFSYNLDVNSNEGNYVSNAVVQVLTNANGHKFHYMNVMGYKGNPFKIKIEDKGAIINEIVPMLNSLGYTVEVVGAGDSIASQVKDIKDRMYLYFLNILFVGVILILLILQNVLSFFNQYKQYLAIRYLNGYGLFENYKEYFYLIFLSWVIVSAIVIRFEVIDLRLQIIISLILIIIEVLLTLLFLVINSQKNVVSIVKGS